MALDIHSPMDLVYECFVKLGLRYVCVNRDGRFAGLVSLSLSFSLPFRFLFLDLYHHSTSQDSS